MINIFFLRHGPTKENIEERVQGQLPGTLLPRETEQYLAAVVPLLREVSIQDLISSDLARSIGTRDILQNFLQAPVLTEDEYDLLRERAMGEYEGKLWKDLPAEVQEERGGTHYDLQSVGGESSDQVNQRVKTFLKIAANKYRGQVLCCVTHAGWLRQLTSIADDKGALPDGWTHRTAIYRTQVNPTGKLEYVEPIPIKAKLPRGDA